MTDVMVVGRGEAGIGGVERYRKGLERKLRYADAVAWTIKGAAASALAGLSDKIDALRDRIGFATATDIGPRDTITEVARAARMGQCSPLRYAAANPGSVASVTCVAFGFRGPSRNLLTSPALAAPLLFMFAEQWLTTKVADIVLLSTFGGSPMQSPTSRCLVLARKDLGAASVDDPNSAALWLSF